MNKGRSFTSASGLLYEFSPVTVDKISTPEDAAKNGVQTTRHRVQLRQIVKLTYPAAKGNALFGATEFGGIAKAFLEQRVCFMNVPAGATPAIILERMEQMESPTLYKILSLKPELTEDQVRTIENGRNPKSYEDYLGDWVPQADGTPALYNGQKQYRSIRFAKFAVEDIDQRPEQYKELTAKKGIQLAVAESPTTVGAVI